jgi:hypothetical protein
MSNRNMMANAMWLVVVCGALTVPFWGHWMFALGVVLMAIAYEMRETVTQSGRVTRTEMVGNPGTKAIASVRRQQDRAV